MAKDCKTCKYAGLNNTKKSGVTVIYDDECLYPKYWERDFKYTTNSKYTTHCDKYEPPKVKEQINKQL